MGVTVSSSAGVTKATADGTYVKQDGTTPVAGDLTVTGALTADTVNATNTTTSSLTISSEADVSGPLIATGGIQTSSRTLTGTSNTITTSDMVVYLDATSGNVAATLPAASTGKWVIDFKRIDSSGNTCTLNRAGSDTIDGATSVTFAALQARQLRSNTSSKIYVF